MTLIEHNSLISYNILLWKGLLELLKAIKIQILIKHLIWLNIRARVAQYLIMFVFHIELILELRVHRTTSIYWKRNKGRRGTRHPRYNWGLAMEEMSQLQQLIMLTRRPKTWPISVLFKHIVGNEVGPGKISKFCHGKTELILKVFKTVREAVGILEIHVLVASTHYWMDFEGKVTALRKEGKK